MSQNTDNPMASSTVDTPVSRTIYYIAGIRTTVYGLDELPKDTSDLACLWLLHPRLATDERMAPIASKSVNHWNDNRKSSKRGLIAVAFDQRNHGSRKIDDLSNETWRKGNARHAQDMFSIYQGTAQDTSLLLTHLPSYLPTHLPTPTLHLVLGVSLGAHSAWHCILHDPRIRAAAIVIGCPDFARLMSDRAQKSKIKDWTASNPPGSSFFGSPSFPDALVAAVNESDPAGFLLPVDAKVTSIPPLAREPTGSLVPEDVKAASVVLDRTLGGKAVLNLAGAVDKLVPHKVGVPFFKFLEQARNGWWKNGQDMYFEDQVFDGVGHAFSPEMAEKTVRFVADVVSGRLNVAAVKGRI